MPYETQPRNRRSPGPSPNPDEANRNASDFPHGGGSPETGSDEDRFLNVGFATKCNEITRNDTAGPDRQGHLQTCCGNNKVAIATSQINRLYTEAVRLKDDTAEERARALTAEVTSEAGEAARQHTSEIRVFKYRPRFASDPNPYDVHVYPCRHELSGLGHDEIEYFSQLSHEALDAIDRSIAEENVAIAGLIVSAPVPVRSEQKDFTLLVERTGRCGKKDKGKETIGGYTYSWSN